MNVALLIRRLRATALWTALALCLAVPLVAPGQGTPPANRATNAAAPRPLPAPPANALTNLPKGASAALGTNASARTPGTFQERIAEPLRKLSQHPYFYPGLAAVPLLLALVFLILARNKQKQAAATTSSAVARASLEARRRAAGRSVQTCNILDPSAGTDRLYQFTARSGQLAYHREQEVGAGKVLPAAVMKGWRHLWQRKLNVAWLPSGHVFLRVIHLPQSDFAETVAMVELQMERLSPIPVGQIVWSLQILPHTDTAQQTVVVVIVARSIVEEYLGRLEAQGYLPDRLELPFLDQLQATASQDPNGAWVYPGATGNDKTAVVAWYYDKTLRNLDFVVLPPEKPAESLREQLTQMAWAGELEGWLTGPPEFYMVANQSAAALWEPVIREGMAQAVQVKPLVSQKELASLTAQRAAHHETETNLLPPEHVERYQQQFVDRLWMRALGAVVLVYLAIVSVYMVALQVALYRTRAVEAQVAEFAPGYTNALQLKAQFEVLKDRQELKYAALDSWRAVAELLPEEVTLEGFNFSDGKRLTLNGTAPVGSVQELYTFEGAMRKSSINGQSLFAPNKGENLSYNTAPGGAGLNWSFSMELKRTEVQ